MQFIAAVRRLTETFSEEEFAAVLEPEAQAVREFYIQGVVRAIWSREDVLGAVLLLEAQSLDAAHGIVQKLPLMQRGMLELQALIPLRGYRGFGPRA